jgi:glycerophosphoryl diester phosphodiesterase
MIKGKIEFKPSEFEKVVKKNQKIIMKDPGHYVVGTEIPAGNYVLSRTSDKIGVFVDIKDETETESLQTIQWDIDEKVKKPIVIELKKGYNVYIDKTGKDGYISNEGDLVLERNNEE